MCSRLFLLSLQCCFGAFSTVQSNTSATIKSPSRCTVPCIGTVGYKAVERCTKAQNACAMAKKGTDQNVVLYCSASQKLDPTDTNRTSHAIYNLIIWKDKNNTLLLIQRRPIDSSCMISSIHFLVHHPHHHYRLKWHPLPKVVEAVLVRKLLT